MSASSWLPQDQASFNCFAQANFVCEDSALRERILECEERGFDLVRVEVDLSVGEYCSEFLDAVSSAAASEIVSEVFCVVVGE